MEKKNTSLIVFIVILSLLVLGLGGFITYDKVFKEKNNKNNNDNENNNVKVELKEMKNVQIVNGDDVNVLVDTLGNAYVLMPKKPNIDDNNYDAKVIKSNLLQFEKNSMKYNINGYVNSNNENTITGYKLNVSNVLSVYNSGHHFIFLKKDGTLSYFYDDIASEEFLKLKNISNVKDAVSVSGSNFLYSPYAITKDGTEISLKDYIK